MKFQDYIIEGTKVAVDEVFRYARNVPADKLEWKPLDEGRSILDICRELAMCPLWSVMILEGKEMPDMSGEQESGDCSGPTLDTVEACEALCRQNLESFYAAVSAFPDEKLKDTYVLPFDGGQTINMEANMDYPRWNFTYHVGQIAYIQTLDGDKKIYW